MEATQMISDSLLESDESEKEEENDNKAARPLAKLCILQNEHIPEKEFPLFLGDNVLGRDHNTCDLPLPAPSISKRHATICISAYRRRYRHGEVDAEALVWDLGSMNGSRKGHLKLTPHVRYALSDGDSLTVADIPCRYVSCAVDATSSQRDTRTPVSRHSGVKSRLPDASGEKAGDKSTEGKKCVNGGRVSLTKTPVRTGCLSFEQTPTQPEGTLVPESDSDSDGDRGGGGDRRHKTLVSESDSHKSSPTCSTFLSPTSKIVPESEDESPITPSSSSKNRPHRHVSFSHEGLEVDVAGQLLEEKKTFAIVDSSEEEDGGEGERHTPEGTESKKSGQHVPVTKERNVSLTGDHESPVSTPEVSIDGIPAFNMDSDTDMEGEEEGVSSAGPVTLNADQANQPPNTAELYMDSDTDEEEDEKASDKAPKRVVSPDHDTEPPHVTSFIQPEGIAVGSDTDVDDDVDAAVSDAAAKTEPTSVHSAPTAGADFHLDSDTDVDEEEESECGTNESNSKLDETPSRLEMRPSGPESAPTASHGLQLDSDTNDEALCVSAEATEACAAAEGGDDVQSDSDTDAEDDSPRVYVVAVTPLSVSRGPATDAPESDSDTDVDESSKSADGAQSNPADLREDSDTDVQEEEEEETDVHSTGDDHIPSLCREKTPGLLLPPLQKCSTPVQVSGGEVENMETQVFLSPSLVPFPCAAAPAAGRAALSPGLDSPEDEDFLVAETQSFILQTRDGRSKPPEGHTEDLERSGEESDAQSGGGGSFQLGLSDSSHLQCQAQALAMENTQAFVSQERSVCLDDTQAYAVGSTADRTSADNDPNLGDRQAYGGAEEPATSPAMPEGGGHADLALEATQAYISKSYDDSEDETDEDEIENQTATAETQPFGFPTSCALSVAETQLISASEEEEGLQQVKPIAQNDKEEAGETSKPQPKPSAEDPFMAQTQPMSTPDDEESDDEDSFPVPMKRKAKPLQLEEEQTQPLMSSDFPSFETQPMATSENEESGDGDSAPGPRKRKAKPLRLEDDESQTLTNSELSALATQLMDSGGEGERDEEPSVQQRRQALFRAEVSVVDTQPMAPYEEESSDEEDLPLGPRKRKAEALRLEDEETQSLVAATQPMFMAEDEGSDDEDSIPVPRKRRATARPIHEEESQPLFISELSADEGQSEEAEAGARPERKSRARSEAGTSGVGVGSTRGTKAGLGGGGGGEEEKAGGPEPPKRQTRGKKGSLPAAGGKRENFSKGGEESEKEELARLVRGEKIKKVQKGGRCETRRNENAEEREREQEETERQQREAEQEKIERERKTKEEERWQAENRERVRLAQEREEREENERSEKIRRGKEEQLVKERKENQEKERLEREKSERQETEKRQLEERLEKERKEQEEQERLQREAKEEEERERLQKEKESKEKQTKERQEKEEALNEAKVTARGRRGARRTDPHSSEQNPTLFIADDDDVPARRTRSRSNSVSSERSASSANAAGGGGRGGAAVRSSQRRRTAAAAPVERDRNESSPLLGGVRSRSNSSNSSHSLGSEVSGGSVGSQSRGRGGRQRGRPRSELSAGPPPAARGGKRRKTEVAPREEEAQALPARTTRGQRRATTQLSEATAAARGEHCQAGEESRLPQGNVRDGSQKSARSETAGTPVPAGGEADGKRKGRKGEPHAAAEEDSRRSKEEGKDATKETESPAPAKRRGRGARATGAAAQPLLGGKVKEESEKVEIGQRRGRGRPSAGRKTPKGPQGESGASAESVEVEAAEPRTPARGGPRKRQAPVDSSPVAKTPRSSSASPAAGGRLRAPGLAYKVLFTGVVDEAGERALARLGGSIAKGVTDMNCLVTDKVRRTVKFLCAVAKGVPIVTTHWLEKSGEAGSFLSTNDFIVKDPEQEERFRFCLQASLGVASSRPLLRGYEIHVTKSVKPEPVQMKDIISCSGAAFLPRMPSHHKPQTVVISCEEDWALCGPAVSVALPIVTAEFILTGILQHKVDFQSHALSAPATSPPPAGGRSRGRKKT